jgi:flagellar biosynthesis/type III secretory pathway M-ring protein FliF/YscJ
VGAELILIALILLVVAVFVTAPLRRSAAGKPDRAEDPRIAELEARKEAKYREIRDAEVDREAGKLTQEEWRGIDRELRREAIQVLKELDRVRGTTKQ